MEHGVEPCGSRRQPHSGHLCFRKIVGANCHGFDECSSSLACGACSDLLIERKESCWIIWAWIKCALGLDVEVLVAMERRNNEKRSVIFHGVTCAGESIWPFFLASLEDDGLCGFEQIVNTHIFLLAELLSERPWKAINAGRPISRDGSISHIRFGCNIHQVSQLVNVLLVAKHCPGRPPLSLTNHSISQPDHRKKP